MTRLPACEDYRTAHAGAGSWSESYDETLFSRESFDTQIWRREKTLLDQLLPVSAQGSRRYLDFACGTGRVLAHLESRFQIAVGLDISSTMLDAARAKVQHASLVCGDATRDAGIVEGPFDVITSFRFFLNAEPKLRDEAMAFLASKLRDRSSRLIFNIHGNALSTRLPVWFNERLHGRPYNQMTYWQVKSLVRRHGLVVRRWFGIGYLDKSIYNRVPRRLWTAVEALLHPMGFLKPFAVYHYFECAKDDNS